MGGDQSSGDGTPTWLADDAPIQVDVSTLHRLATALHDEVQLNLRPHLGRVVDGLDPAHTPFPRVDGFLELQVAWWVYGTCKAQTLNLLPHYAQATSQLAQAAATLAASYRDSDQLAAAKLADVQSALDRATPTPGQGID